MKATDLLGTGFLSPSPGINWDTPALLACAQALSGTHPLEVARAGFLFVRDQISHTMDIGASEVSRSAAEVLENGHGFCYAKSFLLAALLRARGIPTGLCYQRLYDDFGKLILHGFNAIYLESWVKVDARGNKPGVEAQFIPPVDSLAFSPSRPGEITMPEIYANPLPQVIAALKQAEDATDLSCHLPA